MSSIDFELFPEGTVHPYPSIEETLYSIDLENGQWLHLPKSSLTKRELSLLELVQPSAQRLSSDPWYQYFNGNGSLPTDLSSLQLLHVHLWSEIDGESLATWLEMMTDLLPNQVTMFQQTRQDYVFVLDRSLPMDSLGEMQSVLPALEYDFGIKLTILMGQIWPKQLMDKWAKIFQSEAELFAHWRRYFHQSTFLRFSQLFLWGTGGNIEGRTYLKTILRDLIGEQEHLEETILSLWSEGAVLTKAAQALYLHRNTLQYRLEKWQDLTGLQLKELTDLSLCYQVILEGQF